MPTATCDYETHLRPIFEGKVPVPNFEEMAYALLLNNIAAGGHSMRAQWGHATIGDQRGLWAQFFFTGIGMGSPAGGVYGGGGYVIAYGFPAPIVGTFAICRHEKQDGAGADHRRGWHPGRCAKCGINMTVDSGD